MAREYPTYIYTNETEAKSKGEFIVRLVAPRFIAKIIHVTPGKTDINIIEWIDDTTVQQRFEFHAIKQHALKWYLARHAERMEDLTDIAKAEARKYERRVDWNSAKNK